MSIPLNLVEALGHEIARVAEVIGYYENLRGMPQISPLTFSITVPMIRRDLKDAQIALGGGDPLEMMTAYKILEEIK